MPEVTPAGPGWPTCAEAREAVRQLATRDKRAFSAVTIFDGYRRMIVVNDAHSPRRQASDIAHELAHGLLLHKPGRAPGNGIRVDWNPVQEEETQWLAGALLISEEAALIIAREGWTLSEAAERYKVSADMVRFRLNVTGAKKRVERANNYGRARLIAGARSTS